MVLESRPDASCPGAYGIREGADSGGIAVALSRGGEAIRRVGRVREIRSARSGDSGAVGGYPFAASGRQPGSACPAARLGIETFHYQAGAGAASKPGLELIRNQVSRS